MIYYKEVDPDKRRPSIILVFTLAMAYFIFWLMAFLFLTKHNYSSLRFITTVMTFQAIFAISFAVVYIVIAVFFTFHKEEVKFWEYR